MKEAEHSGILQKNIPLTANELTELIRLSEIVQEDGLRYERILRAEEEVDEL